MEIGSGFASGIVVTVVVPRRAKLSVAGSAASRSIRGKGNSGVPLK
jgi:hypothetical protein